MKRGFQYDAALCVSCKACSAACILENGFQAGTRNVYTWNDQSYEPFSVINLSLACNHCEKPACLEGCPAKAYTVDISGAVIHHQEKCMGCKYCLIKCPYDAPKTNTSRGYIEKCHFCYERVADEIDPACVTACPTGALSIIYEKGFPNRNVEWFPETGIGPALKLISTENIKRPVIIPVGDDDTAADIPPPVNRIKKEWSLLAFSLLVIFGASTIISDYLKGTASPSVLPSLLLVSAFLVSLAHLGVRKRAWRSVLNVISSPLSREIVAVATLTLLALFNYIKPGILPALIIPIVALLALISVDLVYFSADGSTGLALHSGQAFFSGILAASFFSGSLNAFILFTMLAAGSVVIRYNTLSRSLFIRNIYYYRALTLPLVLMLLYIISDWLAVAAQIIFISGLIADRALFYDAFKPENIRVKISDHFYNEYEKERDKQRQDTYIS